MKLNAKFSFTVSALALVSIGIMIFMLTGVSSLMKIKDFELDLMRIQNTFQQTMGYSDKTTSRGVNIDTIYSEWEKLTGEVAVSIQGILESNTRKALPAVTNKKIDSLNELWKMVDAPFKDVGLLYKELSEMPLQPSFKLSISSTGFSTALSTNSTGESSFQIEFTLHQLRQKTQSIQTICDTFSSLVETIRTEITADINRQYLLFYRTVILVTVLASVTALFFATRITRRITKRIRRIQDMTGKLSLKDFSVRMEASGNDEICNLTGDLNNTVSILNDFLITVKKTAADADAAGRSINNSAASTAAATHQIDSNIESLNVQVEKLSAAVTRSIKSLNQMIEISAMLLSDNNRQTTAINASQQAVGTMAEHLDTIAQMAEDKTQSAHEIQRYVLDGDEKISSTHTLLQEINGQLDEIAEIVTIINDIAEQTNILSMNAAIESAHAGESGKGFGVVAEEIRVLAESTGDNATRISSSLYAIISKVKDANDTSKSAADAFAKVSESTHDMVVSLTEITDGIKNIDGNMHQVTGKNTELSNASQQINKSCDNLSAQQNVVSNEMAAMSTVFKQVEAGIHEIKIGTADIVKKMLDINAMSSDSCTRMEKLDNILSEFTTVDYSVHIDKEALRKASEEIPEKEAEPELLAEIPEEAPEPETPAADETENGQFETVSASEFGL